MAFPCTNTLVFIRVIPKTAWAARELRTHWLEFQVFGLIASKMIITSGIWMIIQCKPNKSKVLKLGRVFTLVYLACIIF